MFLSLVRFRHIVWLQHDERVHGAAAHEDCSQEVLAIVVGDLILELDEA
jgi:hypothetical protein